MFFFGEIEPLDRSLGTSRNQRQEGTQRLEKDVKLWSNREKAQSKNEVSIITATTLFCLMMVCRIHGYTIDLR